MTALIDLRSCTVNRPTDALRAAMASVGRVGDDQHSEAFAPSACRRPTC
jgi:hypothetical protein